MTSGEVSGIGAGAAAAQEGPVIASGSGIPAFEYQGFEPVDAVAVGDDGSAYFHQTYTYFSPIDQVTLETAQIWRRAPGGSWTRVFASGGNPGSSPGYSGMAVAPDGDVWVKTNAGIESFGPTGGDHVIRTAPDNGFGDIAIDVDGNVWFTSNTDRIGRVDPSGTTTHFAAAVDTRPGRIAVDGAGNAWFTTRNSGIGRITPAGTITTFADPMVSNESHIATDASGNAWFTSPANDRVGRVTPAGVVTTYTDPAGDLDDPQGITRGPGGVMYVASRRSNRIGVVDGSGVITTFTDPVGALDDPTRVVGGGDADELWVIGDGRLYRLSEAAVPGAVRALQSSQGYREVRVWWKPPTSSGGLPLTYRIRRDGAVLGTTNEHSQEHDCRSRRQRVVHDRGRRRREDRAHHPRGCHRLRHGRITGRRDRSRSRWQPVGADADGPGRVEPDQPCHPPRGGHPLPRPHRRRCDLPRRRDGS